MIRVARLLPLSLGVLLACDGAATTTPQINTDAAVLDDGVVAELQGIDVQPLGLLDKSVINLTTGQPITVAVMNYPDFFTAADIGTITFYGASPIHEEQILRNPDCHITEVSIYDADGNVVGTYTASLLHFYPDVSGVGDGEVVPMCLTGSFTDGSPFPEAWCADVTVKNRGGGSGH
jgi:hypothetical protein